jgi:Tol biopolymer transport system component
VVGADGGERRQLTTDPGQSWIGGWALDNDTIVFAVCRRGLWNVAIVSRSTSRVRTLTGFSEPRIYVRYPRWDAFRARVVFDRAETAGRLWAVEMPWMRRGQRVAVVVPRRQ